MAYQYYISKFQGNATNLNNLLTSLTREVNLFIAYGATTIGGVNISYNGPLVTVSQALLLKN